MSNNNVKKELLHIKTLSEQKVLLITVYIETFSVV